jgi:2-dehydro-3-deoxyphosphogluconate aldolase/(4S)-4-hydroxy-2-oxoglutarate aldolase
MTDGHQGAQQTLERIRASGVIGIVRARTQAIALEQAIRVISVGLPVLEVSLTTPGGLEVIEQLAHGDHGAVVGAGTVLDAGTARSVISAGGRVIVCPTFNPDVVRVAVRHDVAVVPGCLTPTEMDSAMRLGATAVKIFPAHTWSPAALAGLLQAMPHLPCVPTGGVGPDNAADWIAAGAVALGVGSALTAVDDPGPVVDQLRRSIDDARRSGD